MKKTVPALIAVLVLAACTPAQERAVIGAGLGCAAGEIIDDGSCVAGAVVGGVAGAASAGL